jgi:diguanylate cyclase (GGDEF)-like protein/PAS domain S-box-containing protein
MSIFFTIFAFAKKNDDITLQLSWLNQFQFAGYYIAKEKGFYNKVGINVNIKEFSQNTDIIEELKNKKADFIVGRSSFIIEKANGHDVVALGAIYQESPLILLVKKDSNINTIKDFKNKNIMITSDAKYSASILAMLSANGIGTKDFITQTHSFNINDLIEGKTDAMASYLSNEVVELERRGIEYKIFNPKDYGFHFYNDILFSSSSFINNNQKLTKDFYEASIKGWEYAFDNIAETAELIYSKYNTQNKSFISLLREGEILKKLAYANNESLGYLDEDKLDKIVDVFKLFGLIQKDINLDELIYSENPHKKLKLTFSDNEQKLLYISLFFILIIFSVIIYSLKRYHKLHNLMDSIINSTDDLIFYKDSKFRYIGCNKSFEEFIGKKEKDIIGKDDFELFDSKFANIFRENDKKVIESNSININEEILTFNSKEIWFQTKKIPLKYKDNKVGILGMSRDINTLKKIQNELKEESYTDELTSIYNRKAFNIMLKEKIHFFERYNVHLSLAMYDIDNFKNINDTYGHDMGDKVLKEMALAAQSNLRKTDLFFRVGGEEFVIIFSHTDLSEAYKVVEKIRIMVSKLQIIDNEKITISLGVSQVCKNDTPQSIYERIDKLMYKSKQNGKNMTIKS